MKLREYMATEPGVYMLAESNVRLTVESFPDDLLDQQVEEYLLGLDAGGRCKFHLYVRSRHVATRFAEPYHGAVAVTTLAAFRDRASGTNPEESSQSPELALAGSKV